MLNGWDLNEFRELVQRTDKESEFHSGATASKKKSGAARCATCLACDWLNWD